MFIYLNKISISLMSLSRNKKTLFVTLTDITFCIFLFNFSYYLRVNELPPTDIDFVILSIVSSFILIFLFRFFGITKEVIRYSNSTILFKSALSIFIYGIVFTLVNNLFNIYNLPRSIYIIHPVILFFYSTTIRLTIKYFLNTFSIRAKENQKVKNILIYGAGKIGIILSDILSVYKNYNLVGFIDDNKELVGRTINGKNIFNYKQISALILKKEVQSIIFSFQGLKDVKRQQLIKKIIDSGISIYTASQFINRLILKNNFIDETEINTLTLIGRNEITPNENLLRQNISNKNVLVTGAGGSIGSELSRQIIKLKPRKLILLENNEFALYKINKELKETNFQNNQKIKIISLLASILDEDRVSYILEKYNPFVIFHAAAYKHVSIVEENPGEAVKVNIFGTKNLLNLVEKYSVKNFVLVSTDKAVRPPNIMGATKRISEQLVELATRTNFKTKYSIVRFGNVIGSSGSVIPIFKEQIKNGGPVTVTHKEVTRYFMTIPEAAQLIIQVGSLSERKKIYVLDMGKPINILSIAKRMINLSGLSIKDEKNKNGDIEISFIGLRKGEKMHEELMYKGEVLNTSHPMIKLLEEETSIIKDINQYNTHLIQLKNATDIKKIIQIIKHLVPDFVHNKKQDKAKFIN